MKINIEKIMDTAMIGMWIVALGCLIYAISGLDWHPIPITPHLSSTTDPSSIMLGKP